MRTSGSFSVAHRFAPEAFIMGRQTCLPSCMLLVMEAWEWSVEGQVLLLHHQQQVSQEPDCNLSHKWARIKLKFSGVTNVRAPFCNRHFVNLKAFIEVCMFVCLFVFLTRHTCCIWKIRSQKSKIGFLAALRWNERRPPFVVVMFRCAVKWIYLEFSDATDSESFWNESDWKGPPWE